MTDPFRKVAKGEALEVPAATWNQMLIAAQMYQRTKLGKGGGDPLVSAVDPTLTFLAQNQTGANLPAGSVIGYGTPLVLPTTDRYQAQKRPAIGGVAPTSVTAPFAITYEDIAAAAPNDMGLAIASGLAVTQIQVSDTSHAFAVPVIGTTANLASDPKSGVPVIWKDSGTGLKSAIVLLTGASQSTSITSGDCSSWSGRIKAGVCVAMSIAPASAGACSCIPAATVPVAFDASSGTLTSTTPIYGCPPGVVTTDCPSGGPLKWRLDVSGFEGTDSTLLNLTWTLTYSGSGIWSQTQGGVTATLVESGGNATLTFATSGSGGTTLATYAITGFACCANNVFSLSGDIDEAVLTAAPATITAQVATGCGLGPAWNVVIDECTNSCGEKKLRMRWTEAAGSGGSGSGSGGLGRTITWTQVGCGTDANGNDTMDFATSDPLICTGQAGEGCTDNSVTARITCNCTCVAWGGIGFYCVSGTCQFVDTQPVNCNTLWAGPYNVLSNCSCTATISCSDTITYEKKLCLSIEALGTPGHTDYVPAQTVELTYYDDPASDPALNACMLGPFEICGLGLSSGPGWYYCAPARLPGKIASAAFIPCGTPRIGVRIIQTYGCGDASFTGPGPPTLPLSDVMSGTLTGGADELGFTLSSGNCPATITPTYNCLDSGGCIDPGDGTGRYTGDNALGDCLADCASSPPPPPPPPAGCAACTLVGLTPTLVVPDGPQAGTYTGSPWADSGGGNVATSFSNESGLGLEVICLASGVVESSFGIVGTASCGPPAVFTLPGSAIGGTSGDLTITT